MPRSLKTGVRLPSWQNWLDVPRERAATKKWSLPFHCAQVSLRYPLVFTLRTVNFLKIW